MIFLPKLIVWILLFLTGDLLNIHKAFPRHTHFKPLSENRATHTVALQKGVYQPYISFMTIHFSISFFSIWQTMEKIQFSNLILEELFFFPHLIYFLIVHIQGVWGDCTELCLSLWLLCTLNSKPERIFRFWFSILFLEKYWRE